jgi:hypothetical protein
MDSLIDHGIVFNKQSWRTITPHSLKIMESLDNRFTSQVDFKNSEYTCNTFQVLK